MPARRHRPVLGTTGEREKTLTTAIVVMGLVTGIAVSLAASDATLAQTLPAWAIPLLFVGAEVHGFADRRGSAVGSLSARAAAMTMALLVGPSRVVVPSCVVAVLVASIVFRELRSSSFARRLGTASLSASTAVTVFAILGGEPLLSDWWKAGLATLSAGAVSGLVFLATAGLGGVTGAERALEALLGLAAVVGGSSLATAACHLLDDGHGVIAAGLVAPFLATALALRVREHETRRLARLSGLHESLQMAQRAHGLETDISQLLSSTCRLVDAEVAWIVLLSRENDNRLVAERGPGRETHLRPAVLTESDEAVIRLAVSADGPVVISREDCPSHIGPTLGRRVVEHAMMIALRGDRGVHGVLFVGRLADEAFQQEEARLFQTFGTHAGLMLENESLEQSLNELTVLKEELRHQAYHDTLTGLANRVLFFDLVSRALDARTASARVAVLFLDLDDFKTVNDTLGHSAGDELLHAVAGRVSRAIRPQDTAARLGGDEFAVLAQVTSEVEAEAIGHRLVTALEVPFTIGGQEIAVHSSVGIALDGLGATADELLRNADVAMYAAKRQGKHRLARFEAHMQQQVRDRHEIATALARSVARGEILVHYQPIVDIESGALVALEALARWRRSGLPLMHPGGFIALADEIGLMPEIGRAVLHEACRQVRTWQKAFPEHAAMTVTVNLAPSELYSVALVREVERALHASGLPPDRLVLEITETGVMRRPREALRTMQQLRDMGVSLALDDFGTGHSSLAHLRDFPMDVLKIAQPFIGRLPHSEVDATFIDTIMRLATSLGMHVIAEGIESHSQASALAAIGCPFGQGFLYGEPVSQMGVTRYLSARRLPSRPLGTDMAA